jgi:hypothetical protein
MRKVDCFNYWPGQHTIIGEVKNRLPSDIKASLMQGSLHADYGIYVERDQHGVICELDKLLHIGRKREFGKDHIVEIDESGIPEYDYFFIKPRDFENGRGVFFDMSRPCCSLEWCPWGSRIVSPVTIRSKTLKRLGIGRISRIWDFQTVELIISAAVKHLFESNDVTGLQYDPCWPSDDGCDHKSTEPPAFVARIVRGTYQCANDLDVGKNYCAQHSITIGPYPFCLWTPREALSQDDFQILTSIRVGAKEYFPYKSLWVVSRKVVVMLLQHKVSGLQQATVFMKKPFRPLLLDDNPCEGP